METVNVYCSECHQLIGISRADMGYHVECPLCQKVFLASQEPEMERSGGSAAEQTEESAGSPPPMTDAPSASPSPPAMNMELPDVADRESIFAPPEADSDDLFGETTAPQIEMPPNIESPAKPDSEPVVQAYLDSSDSSDAIADDRVAASDLEGPTEVFARAAEVGQEAPILNDRPADSMPASGEFPSASAAASPTIQRVKRGSIVPVILLIFLIPYCLVTTAFIIWIVATKQAQNRDPLERMLEDPRRNAPQNGIERIQHDLPVPKKLRVSLHQSLVVDKVEVKPLKVVLNPDGDLKLHLYLRNASQNLKFNPLPAKFTQYDGRRRQMKPYVFLEQENGGVRVYGGDLQWFKGPKGQEQLELDATLSPNETMTAVLTTNPEERGRIRTLLGGKRPLLWRVHLRRGLEFLAGRDRVITCVVGVEFSAGEVQRQTS